ncbi:MAG TPA: hypothetical protein VFG37_13855, partial [Planctomycetota bacterium]|nr:hypothetical protein [Planctomycetota bacterium]
MLLFSGIFHSMRCDRIAAGTGHCTNGGGTNPAAVTRLKSFPLTPSQSGRHALASPTFFPTHPGPSTIHRGINMLVRGISVAIASLLATSVAAAQTVYPTGT